MTMTLFKPAIEGFAFHNHWTLDSQEKEKIHELFQAGVAPAVAALGPFLAPGAGVIDAFAAAFGIPPGTIEATGLAATMTGQLNHLLDGALPEHYGLCGGMAYAALDYYTANLTIQRGFPDGPRPDIAQDFINPGRPERNTPEGNVLRSYIWQRLIESFVVGGAAATTLEWMAVLHFVPTSLSGGAPELLRRTRGEWAKLKMHLDQGEPWPLGLIGTASNPMDNHQVLAYGYDDHNVGTVVIYLYDSNCPNDDSWIQLNFNGQALSLSESCNSSDRGQLQGFFCSSYQPNSSPPAAIGTTQTANIIPSAPGQDRKVTVSYTAANVGFGKSLPLQLYVRGVGQIPVRDGNGDGGDGAGSLKTEAGPGGPPLHTTQFIHFTSSTEASNSLMSIESPVSDSSPHGAAPENAITRQLTSAESPTLQDGSWSFFPEVYFGNVEGVDIYKLLPIVQKPKEGKESKEGKDGKEKEKEAAKDRKDNKETAKEKEQDVTGFAGSMPMSGMKGVAFSGQDGNGEAPRATGQAFIRSEERPDVGRRILQQPANE